MTERPLPQMPSVLIALVEPRTGVVTNVWARFLQYAFNILTGKSPVPLGPYTVATLPDPERFAKHMIYVEDEAGGPVPAFSDGTNWRRVTDRAVVS